MSLTNPFFSQSVLPYQAPRFDLIEDSHYRPAFDEGMRQKRAEIDAIVQNPQAPDFENTYLALEQSGALLTRVTSVFFAMTAAHTNDELQRLDEAFSAELAALANDIYLNSTLFARVDAVWRQRRRWRWMPSRCVLWRLSTSVLYFPARSLAMTIKRSSGA